MKNIQISDFRANMRSYLDQVEKKDMSYRLGDGGSILTNAESVAHYVDMRARYKWAYDFLNDTGLASGLLFKVCPNIGMIPGDPMSASIGSMGHRHLTNLFIVLLEITRRGAFVSNFETFNNYMDYDLIPVLKSDDVLDNLPFEAIQHIRPLFQAFLEPTVFKQRERVSYTVKEFLDDLANSQDIEGPIIMAVYDDAALREPLRGISEILNLLGFGSGQYIPGSLPSQALHEWYQTHISKTPMIYDFMDDPSYIPRMTYRPIAKGKWGFIPDATQDEPSQ